MQESAQRSFRFNRLKLRSYRQWTGLQQRQVRYSALCSTRTQHKHARRERAALARSHARPFSLRIRIDLLHRLPVVALRLRLRSRFLLPSLQNVELTLASRQHYFMICCFQTDLQASAGTGDAAVALQVRQVHMHAAASFELSHVCI